MVDFGVLCTYKKYGGWSRCKLVKIEGYGGIDGTPSDELCQGMLVSLVHDGQLGYLFIADKSVIDPDCILGGDRYLFHEGVFPKEKANGRCWFLEKVAEEGNLIRTKHNGVFTKCEYNMGVFV